MCTAPALPPVPPPLGPVPRIWQRGELVGTPSTLPCSPYHNHTGRVTTTPPPAHLPHHIVHRKHLTKISRIWHSRGMQTGPMCTLSQMPLSPSLAPSPTSLLWLRAHVRLRHPWETSHLRPSSPCVPLVPMPISNQCGSLHTISTVFWPLTALCCWVSLWRWLIPRTCSWSGATRRCQQSKN